MPNKWSPGCGCCGGCTVADTDGSGGFTADGASALSLAAGEGAITDTRFTQPGYSIAAFLDLTLGSASGPNNVRSITAGDITDFEGLRFEVVNDSDVVVAYAEMETLKKLVLDGDNFTYSNVSDGDPFFTEQSPLVQAVFDVAKVEVCFTERALQMTTWFKYQGGYQWHDAAGAQHYHYIETSAQDFGVTVSVPYEHTEDVRLRVKNNGSSTMDFTRLVAAKNYDQDTFEFDDYEASTGYYYGCETSTPEYNSNCESCQRVCTLLPGNRVHDFEIVSHPFDFDITAQNGLVYDNCGFSSGSDSVLDYDVPTKMHADFVSDAVADPNTGERISGTITETYTHSTPAATASVSTLGLSVSGSPGTLTECGIEWNFTVQIKGCLFATLQSSASTSVSTDDPIDGKTWDPQPVYMHPDGPPPDIEGTSEIRVSTPYGIGYNTVTIYATVEVPLFNTCSPVVRIPLASGSPSLLVLFESLSVAPKYSTNSNGDYLISQATWTQTRKVIDLDGEFLEIRIC